MYLIAKLVRQRGPEYNGEWSFECKSWLEGKKATDEDTVIAIINDLKERGLLVHVEDLLLVQEETMFLYKQKIFFLY